MTNARIRLLAVAMAVASVATTLLLATPASSFTPFTPLAAEAVFKAGTALANSKCEELIGAGSRSLLTTLRNDDRIREMADQDPVVDGQRVAASTNGIGLGAFAQISLFAAFYEGAFVPLAYSPVPSTPLSGSEVRAVILLHELGHATGAHGRHSREDPGFEFNGEIVNRCIRPPVIQPPQGLLIDFFNCQPLPLGGTRDVSCQATWVGGVDPATVQWVATQAPRAPIVNTNAAAHYTSAIFKCDPIPPRDTEYTYQATVIVTDRLGTRAYVTTIPCGW